MASLVTAPLGSKENPHSFKKGQKRKKGHYYLKNYQLKCWDGKRLRKENRNEYDSKYREKKKDYYRKKSKEYRENNKEKIKEYYENNKENIRRYKKCWDKNNREKMNKYNKNKYHNDMTVRLIHNQRTSIAKLVKKNNLSKTRGTKEYLCCSEIHLKEHIVSQYEEWMNDSNFGVYNPNGPRTWQVDHRVPKAYFKNLKENEEEKYMLLHWTNLQPLCSKENTANKRDNFDPETFRYKWWGKEIGWLGIPKYLMPNTSL